MFNERLFKHVDKLTFGDGIVVDMGEHVAVIGVPHVVVILIGSFTQRHHVAVAICSLQMGKSEYIFASPYTLGHSGGHPAYTYFTMTFLTFKENVGFRLEGLPIYRRRPFAYINVLLYTPSLLS